MRIGSLSRNLSLYLFSLGLFTSISLSFSFKRVSMYAESGNPYGGAGLHLPSAPVHHLYDHMSMISGACCIGVSG